MIEDDAFCERRARSWVLLHRGSAARAQPFGEFESKLDGHCAPFQRGAERGSPTALPVCLLTAPPLSPLCGILGPVASPDDARSDPFPSTVATLAVVDAPAFSGTPQTSNVACLPRLHEGDVSTQKSRHCVGCLDPQHHLWSLYRSFRLRASSFSGVEFCEAY